MTDRRESFRLHGKARAKREQAMRCRTWLKGGGQENAAALLTDYAMELEESAELLESLAGGRGRLGRRPTPAI